MFLGFALEVIGELDDLGEVPCAFYVFSAFPMRAKRKYRVIAGFVGLARNGDRRIQVQAELSVRFVGHWPYPV
jgi:hypothetical protein